ncbi:MAG: hypothetical protein V3575_05750 [Candidatus Absconditabacteria bacterium]
MLGNIGQTDEFNRFNINGGGVDNNISRFEYKMFIINPANGMKFCEMLNKFTYEEESIKRKIYLGSVGNEFGDICNFYYLVVGEENTTLFAKEFESLVEKYISSLYENGCNLSGSQIEKIKNIIYEIFPLIRKHDYKTVEINQKTSRTISENLLMSELDDL